MSASVRGIERWGRWLVRALLDESPRAYLTSTRRTRAEQTVLYRRWLAGTGRRAAPPGRSLHEVGLAFDVHAAPDELRRLGRLWTGIGGVWKSTHPIHFELNDALRDL